jgi:16S rRNA (cytidine1402-2'-O)-methyltransferase
MLYIIPTPIGNREDITLRALRLFKELEIFICEDTRTLKKLLSMYEIGYSNKQFYSLTSFTDQGKMNHYLNILSDNDI